MEGPQGSETSGLPHFLDNWLTDGSQVKKPIKTKSSAMDDEVKVKLSCIRLWRPIGL
jgi:hypothetical protein